MDERNPQKTTKEKAQEAGKDVVELAAKGAATYFGGPVGGQIADAVTKTKTGQQILNRAGDMATRNPAVKSTLSASQPIVSKAKPAVNQAFGFMGGKPGNPTNTAELASNAPTITGNVSGASSQRTSAFADENSTVTGSGYGGSSTPPPKKPFGFRNSDSAHDGEGDSKSDGFIVEKWKKLPLKVKLILLAIIAGVAVLLIVVSAIVGIIPFNFLDYSNEVGTSKDIEKEYSEFWKEFCSSEEDGCSEEQKKAAEEFQKSQLEFYEKLESLAKNNSLSKKQKYLVLTTIFLGYDIDDFTEGHSAFTLDGDDEINEDPSASVDENNVYVREKDSLKELVKQFKISTAICTYDQKLDNGEMQTGLEYPMRDLENNLFVFNFFDKVRVFFGDNPKEGFKEARDICEARINGKVSVEATNDKEAAIEGFYNYLKTTDYLDVRPQLSSYYSEYAKNNRLSLDVDSWAEEEKIEVREIIIKDIRGIVDEFEKESGPEFIASPGRAYWWPIGSLEIDENGLAAGDPQFTRINSNYGYRVHPISGKKHLHNGVDLAGTMGETNIIASLGGEVISIVNSCVSKSVTDADMKCGGSYGNHVKIQDTKGNVTIYAHMYKDSITVNVGDTVSQGQVIGKVGSSGSSTGAHLHFTLIINGATVNPLDYIDASNPRPASFSTVDFNSTSYTREEFIARVEAFYSSKNCAKSGCESFKHEVTTNGGAATIYDVASSHNLNPELVVARSELEGYSPGTYYNYFGYGCTNTGGIAACYKFTSFKAGMEEFFQNISQYDSVESMMSRYAYLGKYWYTGTHWDIGGCAYATYIYPDGVPDRVSAACSQPDGYCSVQNTANCEPTTQEDTEAYTRWQVYKMATVIEGIFG